MSQKGKQTMELVPCWVIIPSDDPLSELLAWTVSMHGERKDVVCSIKKKYRKLLGKGLE